MLKFKVTNMCKVPLDVLSYFPPHVFSFLTFMKTSSDKSSDTRGVQLLLVILAVCLFTLSLNKLSSVC